MLLNQIESFNFHFQLHCWQQILSASDILSKYQQSSSIVSTAISLINAFQNQIAELRSDKNFEKLKESLEAFNSLNGENFVRSRRFSTYDEADVYVKCQVFYALHDKLQVEIDDRFRDFN